MKFKESKKVGDVLEVEVLKRIQIKYSQAFIDDKGKKFSDWDIFIPEINEGIEVKGDYMSKITGNLVVEVEMYDKPSALSITKAKYWVFIEGYRFIWIKPISIYRFIEQNNCQRTSWVGSGDDQVKKAYLIKHEKFVKYIYTLDKEDGWVDMINKNNVLYYDNFSKKFKLKNEKVSSI